MIYTVTECHSLLRKKMQQTNFTTLMMTERPRTGHKRWIVSLYCGLTTVCSLHCHVLPNVAIIICL